MAGDGRQTGSITGERRGEAVEGLGTARSRGALSVGWGGLSLGGAAEAPDIGHV